MWNSFEVCSLPQLYWPDPETLGVAVQSVVTSPLADPQAAKNYCIL